MDVPWIVICLIHHMDIHIEHITIHQANMITADARFFFNLFNHHAQYIWITVGVTTWLQPHVQLFVV